MKLWALLASQMAAQNRRMLPVMVNRAAKSQIRLNAEFLMSGLCDEAGVVDSSQLLGGG